MFVNYKILMNNYRNERRNEVHPEFSIFEEILEAKNYNINDFNTYSLTDKIRCEFELFLTRIAKEEKDGKLPNNYERWEKVQKEFESIVNKNQKVEFQKSKDIESQDDIKTSQDFIDLKLNMILRELDNMKSRHKRTEGKINKIDGFIVFHIVTVFVSVSTFLYLFFGK
jgi:hypothetical protein